MAQLPVPSFLQWMIWEPLKWLVSRSFPLRWQSSVSRCAMLMASLCCAGREQARRLGTCVFPAGVAGLAPTAPSHLSLGGLTLIVG